VTDKTTKILLAAIALALWANLAAPLFRSSPAGAKAKAEFDNLSILGDIHLDLSDIATGLSDIATGKCRNSKIC
jgi:hypothetical protein